MTAEYKRSTRSTAAARSAAGGDAPETYVKTFVGESGVDNRGQLVNTQGLPLLVELDVYTR